MRRLCRLRGCFSLGQRRLRQVQALDKSSHRAGRRAGSRLFDQLHNCAAHYRGIREPGHLCHVFRVADAEPDGYRQRGSVKIVNWRMRSTSAAASEVMLCCLPVMPTREMA